MKKILVTGSRGFIGGHLKNRLMEDGFIGRSAAEMCDIFDITNLSQLQYSGEDPEMIIHLAAKTSIEYSFENPFEIYHTNIGGTLNLLELARTKNIAKFIFLSTYVYGQPKYLPIDERHSISPHAPYNQSKFIAEQLCETYSKNFGIDIVTLRPFYIYGPSSRPASLVPSLLRQIKQSGGVILSGEDTRRDLLFVQDFIDLIEAVIREFPEGYNMYNVGYGKSFSLEEVSEILATLLKKKIKIEYDGKMRPNDVREMVADISKVSKEFNWKPVTTIENGLKMCIKISQNI